MLARESTKLVDAGANTNRVLAVGLVFNGPLDRDNRVDACRRRMKVDLWEALPPRAILCNQRV